LSRPGKPRENILVLGQAAFSEMKLGLHPMVSDTVHSEPGDERLAILGYSNRGRLLVVVHSEEEEQFVFISARRPTHRERSQYEQG